jgi:hypothetical protein
MTEAQREGYIHCWNVVGSLMGIRAELLPATWIDAHELFEAIRKRQHGRSDAGQKLTAALLGALQDAIPGEHHDALPAALTRRLIGHETADALGIARATGFTRLRLDLLLAGWALGARILRRFYKDRPFRFLSEKLHKAILVRMGGLEGVPFEVPSEFVQQWFPEGQSAAAVAPMRT